MAGHHWRSIRTRFLNDGIADPMALTSIHALLDKVESVVTEAVAHSAENKPGAAKAAVETFTRELYTVPPELAKLNGGTGLDPDEIPEGFETPAAVEKGFDAFAAMLGGRKRR